MLGVNPVTGDEVTDIGDPTVHLTGYEIGDVDDDSDSDAVVERIVIVTNQFGEEQELLVNDPETLMVPSEKNGEPSDLNLDHFQCYGAEGVAVNVIVDLEDQFGASQNWVGEPELFCNPVNKNGEGIIDELNHLTCYEIGEGVDDDSEEFDVQVNNQFGARPRRAPGPGG